MPLRSSLEPEIIYDPITMEPSRGAGFVLKIWDDADPEIVSYGPADAQGNPLGPMTTSPRVSRTSDGGFFGETFGGTLDGARDFVTSPEFALVAGGGLYGNYALTGSMLGAGSASASAGAGAPYNVTAGMTNPAFPGFTPPPGGGLGLTAAGSLPASTVAGFGGGSSLGFGTAGLLGAGAAGAAGAAGSAGAAGAGAAGTAAAGAAGASLIPGISNALLGAGVGGLLGSGALGGNKPAGTTTSVQDIPEWQKPYVMQAMNSARGLLNTPTDNTMTDAASANLMSTVNGDYLNSNPGNAAYQALSTYENPNESLLRPTAEGAYLNANPYIDATYNKAARGVTDNYNYSVMPQLSRQYGNMQAFGGNSSYGELFNKNSQQLATGLGDLATGIYGQNYANERTNQQNAQFGLLSSANTSAGIRAGGASGLSGNYNTARQQQLTAATAAPGFQQGLLQNRWQPTLNYAQVAGQKFGGQESNPYFTNSSGGLLSGALTGYALSNAFR